LSFLLDIDTQILHEIQMQMVALKKLTDAIVDIAAYIKQFVNLNRFGMYNKNLSHVILLQQKQFNYYLQFFLTLLFSF